MADQKIKLTKKTVDQAQPGATRYRIWDTELEGFGLRVTPKGAKSYFIVYRPDGGGRGVTSKEYTIGRHGPVTPDEARTEAKNLLARVRLGSDPQAQRQDNRAEMTVAELCDLYIAEGMAMKKASTQQSDTYRINSHIRPLLGTKRVSKVDSTDIERFIQTVAEGRHVKRKPSKLDVRKNNLGTVETRKRHEANTQGGKGTATRTTITLSAMFSFACRRKLRADNPCTGVQKFTPGKSERFLNFDELKRLGDALANPDLNPKGIAIIRLLLLVGARKSEIQKLRHDEVDPVVGFLKLKDSKTGQKIVPLGLPAVEILLQFWRKSESAYVFPSDDPELDKPFVGVAKIWYKVREAAGIEDVRLHDLRHTFASIGMLEGKALEVVGAIFGHKDIKTTKRYAHLGETPVRQAARDISTALANRLIGTSGQSTPLD